MRVDVPDPCGVDPRPLESPSHHLGDPDGLGIGLCHVVRVVRPPVSEHLRIHAGASRPDTLELLDDQHAGSFPHDEARTSRVERARRTRRVLFLRDQPSHGAEAGEDDGMHAGLRSARENDVRVPPANDLCGLADGV